LPFFYGWTGAPRVTFTAIGAIVIAYGDGLLSRIDPISADQVSSFARRGLSAWRLSLPSLLVVPAAGRLPVYLIGVLALILVATTRTRALGTYSHASP
jgi:hypothetical protein